MHIIAALGRAAAIKEAHFKSVSLMHAIQKLAIDAYLTRRDMAMPTDADLDRLSRPQYTNSSNNNYPMTLAGTGGRYGGLSLSNNYAPQQNTNSNQYSLNLYVPNFTGSNSINQMQQAFRNQLQNTNNKHSLITKKIQPTPKF